MSLKFPPPSHPTDDLAKLLGAEFQVTLEYLAERDGVLGGVTQVIALLGELHSPNMQLWSVENGSTFKHGDVVMRVRGRYLEYASVADALAGILATYSGWATVTRDLVNAAKPLPLLFADSTHVHPALRTELQTMAVEHGCLASDSELGRGVVAHDLILLTGDAVRAAKTSDVPCLVPVDLIHEPTDEAPRVALALGEKLFAVILNDETADPFAMMELSKRVREQLNLAGFPRVKIFVSGALTAEKIREWQQAALPLDGYIVGDAIALAPPLPFTLELRECDGKPLARRGQTPGTTPSLRLQRVDL